MVFAFGLLLMIALWVRKVKGAILISIVVTTVLAIVVEAIARPRHGVGDDPTGWALNVPALPGDIVEKPDFGTLGEFSLLGSFEEVGVVAALLLVFTLMLADFFDTMGTMTAIGAEAGLLDEEGMPPNTQRILVVDSIAAAAGGAAGVSSNTSYIESAVRRRRGRPHRPGLGRDRRAVPGHDPARAAGRRRSRPRPRCRRWSSSAS